MHTKRLPLWISYDPEADDADALRERIAAGAEAFREDYRSYVEAHRDESTEPSSWRRPLLRCQISAQRASSRARRACRC